MQSYSNKPYMIERILSAGTYLTAGFVGLGWLVLATLLKKSVTPFLMYHIMQSFFISILFFLFTIFCQLIGYIPILNYIPYLINIPLPFIFNFSILQTFTTTIILYCTITSFMGYYSYIPWVSNIINRNCGR